jgi:ABC-type multidrug transport system ATPase subunit
VLSGFNTANVAGTIKIDDVKRSYIMQSEILHEVFTVQELMMFSVNVKNGFQLSTEEKERKVRRILGSLGLVDKKNTEVKFLSGGQLKRLDCTRTR